MRRPFLRTLPNGKKCWYVKDELGKFIRLDPDKRKAHDLWQRMVERSNYRSADATLEALFEAYLRHAKHELSDRRWIMARHIFELLCVDLGPSTIARTVTQRQLRNWLGKDRVIWGEKRPWSIGRQWDAGKTIKRAYNWARKAGHLPYCEVCGIELQQPKPRKATISYELHTKLVAHCRAKRSKPFALVLIALRLSGARPQAIRTVEAKDCESGCWVIANHKTAKKTNAPLVIINSGCLQTLTKILAARYPTGPLFRTVNGKPWAVNGITARFQRLKRDMKIQGITAYAYRHTLATDLLESGASLATVAALLGHASPAMVMRVYGHLDQRHDHLAEALRNMRKK